MDETTNGRALVLSREIIWVPTSSSFWNYPDHVAEARKDHEVRRFDGHASGERCEFCRARVWFDDSVPNDNFEPAAPGYWRTLEDDDAACVESTARGDMHVPRIITHTTSASRRSTRFM